MLSQNNFLLVYLKSVARGVVMSIILLLITTAVFFFTDINESYIDSAIWIITIISICYAGIFGAIKIESKGFLHGAAIGVIYILIVLIIAILTEQGEINLTAFITMFTMAAIVGALSGMIGSVLLSKE